MSWNGYETDKPCERCGKKPAKIEPRFLYAYCEECNDIPPNRFRDEDWED